MQWHKFVNNESLFADGSKREQREIYRANIIARYYANVPVLHSLRPVSIYTTYKSLAKEPTIIARRRVCGLDLVKVFA